MSMSIRAYGRRPLPTGATVVPPPARAFALPAHLARKADPALIARDEEHLAAVGASLRARAARRRRSVVRVTEQPQDIRRVG